ncbi:YihY/virulence factor BrkB family protein [Wenyingzhuangia sp. 2_MG-2023]|uniref:YihY/virulence factor BrkB family protein n=1 Tax=Wenyingzhuangia sp. 2_MG-2023 TaxID=3062639 RepID=UPI0026E2746D|nr:YihY/virulence factor BrkB family protein [Wenyingzhuangia sp. 2_MG-2023]MDO6737498.1 YihY/virulence factor BrkB family protein [Wenyingzhuangia sp. 2_MG-2023]
MKISLKKTQEIIVETYKQWNKNDPFQMSAAISYYALFSFPALLIIIIHSIGFFYSESQVKTKIINEIASILGRETAVFVENILENSYNLEQSKIALIIGVITLLYGATGLFIALQKALNKIWGVPESTKRGFFKLIKDRLFSLSLVLIIGFLLLTSLILTSVINALTDWIRTVFPEFILLIFQIVNFVIPLLLITVLFALIFKILPDAVIKWTDVWLGSFVTSLLFSIGKQALGIYFAKANPESTFGAAGSVILILLWVSYSSLILFFGAEFTKVYALKYGDGILSNNTSKS